VLNKFMMLLKRGESSPESWAQSGSEMWQQSGMVQIKRGSPLSTASGKILPFHLHKENSHPTECTTK